MLTDTLLLTDILLPINRDTILSINRDSLNSENRPLQYRYRYSNATAPLQLFVNGYKGIS